MIRLHNTFALALFSFICFFISCSNPKEQEVMNYAESIMETHPDSALAILTDIEQESLTSKKQQAHYALLKSMALDKNYIDTTSFDVLQPAIDYFLKHGAPDEKLKTYYYQGIIFLNRGDRDKALYSFIKALDISNNCTDSLTVARTLVAQGHLYTEFFDFNSYICCFLKAANIYNLLSQHDRELDCLFNALNGSIVLENKALSDSIINCINSFDILNDIQKRTFDRQQLSYAMKFGTENDIRNLIAKNEFKLNSHKDILNLALAYNKIGNYSKAQYLLDCIKNSNQPYDTLRYLSISVPVLEGIGNSKEALSSYKRFCHIQDSINLFKFEQKAKSIEEKHQMELDAQKKFRHKSIVIWSCFGGIAILSMGLFILILFVRSNKTKKELALEKVKAKESENAKLKSEKENLTLENKNLQLERDKKVLEAENLAHRVETLENESESLKALIEDKGELPKEVNDAIKVRIEMLNSLLASYITSNDQYEKSYDIWVKELTENTREFMNSNRLAFQASHPNFIQYFEDHGLSIEEINYVCLYAIGLRGKEVGNYMKKRSHVNTSSAIRKKLNIDKHETNIGIYVRKLLKAL